MLGCSCDIEVNVIILKEKSAKSLIDGNTTGDFHHFCMDFGHQNNKAICDCDPLVICECPSGTRLSEDHMLPICPLIGINTSR